MSKFLKLKSLCFGLCMIIFSSCVLTGCVSNFFPSNDSEQTTQTRNLEEVQVEENGTYTSKEEVAAYLIKYERLPSNFITKEEALELGWINSEGNLNIVAPGKSIGGSPLEYVADKLEQEEGRKYYECDINYKRGYRNAERLVYSNDGLIYYTPDHYETFELLYTPKS